MPVTEDDLRALLRERTTSVPATPDLARTVQDRVRRRHRQELAAAALAVVVVLVGAALVVLPRPSATPPAGPSPTPSPSTGRTVVIGPQSIGDLDVTTEGPLTISGTTPFLLRITVHNTGARAWNGLVAIGLVHDAVFPGWFDGGLLTLTGGFDTWSDLGATLPDRAVVGGKPVTSVFDGVSLSARQTVAAGATRTWTFTAVRDTTTAVPGDVVGWVPSIDPVPSGALVFGDVSVASPVAVTPTASTLSCAVPTITSTSQGKPTDWQVSDAATAVVGTDRRARWTDVSGLDPQQMSLSSTATGDVRDTMLARALADSGVGRPSGFGPEAADRPARMAPGRYVTYAGYTILPISFTATCAPSGAAIAGTWDSYDAVTTGLLDCATNPPQGSIGAEVQLRFCPR